MKHETIIIAFRQLVDLHTKPLKVSFPYPQDGFRLREMLAIVVSDKHSIVQ